MLLIHILLSEVLQLFGHPKKDPHRLPTISVRRNFFFPQYSEQNYFIHIIVCLFVFVCNIIMLKKNLGDLQEVFSEFSSGVQGV